MTGRPARRSGQRTGAGLSGRHWPTQKSGTAYRLENIEPGGVPRDQHAHSPHPHQGHRMDGSRPRPDGRRAVVRPHPGPVCGCRDQRHRVDLGTSTPYQVGTCDSSGPPHHATISRSSTARPSTSRTMGRTTTSIPHHRRPRLEPPTDDWDTAGHPTGLRFESITVVKNGVATVIDRSTWLIDIGDTTTSTGPSMGADRPAARR